MERHESAISVREIWSYIGPTLSEAAILCSSEVKVQHYNAEWQQLISIISPEYDCLPGTPLLDMLATIFPLVHAEYWNKLRSQLENTLVGPENGELIIHESGLKQHSSIRIRFGRITVSKETFLLIRLETYAESLLEKLTPQWLNESILEDLPIIMNVCDQSLRQIWANRTFCRELQIDKKLIFGKRLTELAQLTSLENLEQLSKRSLETRSEQSEILHIYVARRLVILDVTYYPVFDPTGEPIYAVGAARDITARIKSQETKAAAQNLLNDVLEQMPIAFIAADINLNILRVNASAVKIFGYSRAELVGAELNTLIAPKNRPQNRELLQQFLRKENPEKPLSEGSEIIGLKSNGAEFPMRVSALRLAFGGFPLFCLMILDMTEIRATEARVIEAESHMRQMQKQEALGQLAGNIAHDFNNLMAIALGYAENVGAMPDTPASIRDKMEEIKKAMERGAGLTRQILAYAKHQNLEVSPRNMHELLKENRSMIQAALSISVKLHMRLESSMPFVRIDEGQFMQVILNLAVNARDAMPNGGEFTITTAAVQLNDEFFAARGLLPQTGDYLYLTAADSGTGIPENLISRIFDPYFSTKPRERGTGLGLSVVYGIIKQHGGYIFCDSTLGAGTRFEIFLPVLDTAASIAPVRISGAGQSNRGSLSNLKVLVVEDEAPLRKLLEKQLRGEGMTVFSAAGGREALDFIDSFSGVIDIIISDIMMPGMTGIEMAEEAAILQPESSFIFISGYSQDLLPKNKSTKVVHLLIKPFTKDKLLREISEVIFDKSMHEPPPPALT